MKLLLLLFFISAGTSPFCQKKPGYFRYELVDTIIRYKNAYIYVYRNLIGVEGRDTLFNADRPKYFATYKDFYWTEFRVEDSIVRPNDFEYKEYGK